jgi:transposase
MPIVTISIALRAKSPAKQGSRQKTLTKLLIALWRLVTTGEVPDGVELRPAA